MVCSVDLVCICGTSLSITIKSDAVVSSILFTKNLIPVFLYSFTLRLDLQKIVYLKLSFFVEFWPQ